MVAHKPNTATQSLYEQDFNLWLESTVQHLKTKRFDEIDWENLIEEIESLGRSDRRELRNRLIVLLEHLLKLAYWEQERGYSARGWQDTIREQRRQIKFLLSDSPSLKLFLVEILAECYADAKDDVEAKTALSITMFPTTMPLGIDELLNFDVFLGNP